MIRRHERIIRDTLRKGVCLVCLLADAEVGVFCTTDVRGGETNRLQYRRQGAACIVACAMKHAVVYGGSE